MAAVRVKICGIRTLEDARWAVEAGADAVGFVFAPSPRQVSPAQAAAICRRLPPFVTRVGVFVNEDPDRVVSVAKDCGLDAAQLHGDEPPERCCLGPGLRVIKAMRVGNQDLEALLAAAGRYEVDAVLLDTKVEHCYGGSGVTFDWQLAAAFRRRWQGPVILAGGLNQGNVLAAVRMVRPWAVDISSGVESNGRKDRKQLGDLMTLLYYFNSDIIRRERIKGTEFKSRQ